MTAADDLVVFLKERIDEDEALAQVWVSAPWCEPGEDASHWKDVGSRQVRYDNQLTEQLRAIDVSGRTVNWSEAIWLRWDTNGERAQHIARHDPARVLREVAAKRAILELHKPNSNLIDQWTRCYHCNDDYGQRRPYPCQTVRLLAAIYDGHPDYRQEWKPVTQSP